MPTYPVHVPLDSYRGNNARRLACATSHNQRAARIEAYLNTHDAEQTLPREVISYGEIAQAVGLTIDDVREICFAIDGGSGGITMTK